jgi:type I restriction enzyme, S subunit
MELKSGYKKTEVGIIPEDWDVIDAIELEPFITSGSRGWAKYYSDRGALFMRITNLFRDCIYPDLTDKVFVDLPDNETEGRRTALHAGDILISITADIGVIGFVDNSIPLPAYINQHIACIRLRPDKANSLFQSYYLASHEPQRRFREMTDVGAKTGINLKTVGKIKLLSLPVAEQKAIATALSDIDALLAGLKRLVAKKRDLKQATMQQLLTGRTRLPGFCSGWKETTLGEIGECIIGLTYKPENVTEYGLLVLRSSNVQDGRLAYHDNVYVNLSVPDHLYTQSGDILVCVRNGSRALIGKCAPIGESAVGLTFGAFMSIYRTKYWRFIIHAFQADGIQRQIRDNIGATINQITNKDMKAFRVQLPPEDEQLAISTILNDMDAEITALEHRLSKTRDLKQAMMQELLTGKTRLVTLEAIHA